MLSTTCACMPASLCVAWHSSGKLGFNEVKRVSCRAAKVSRHVG